MLHQHMWAFYGYWVEFCLIINQNHPNQNGKLHYKKYKSHLQILQRANLSTVVAVHRLLILQDINATNTSLLPRLWCWWKRWKYPFFQHSIVFFWRYLSFFSLFGRACVRVMVVMKTTTLPEVPSFHATNAGKHCTPFKLTETRTWNFEIKNHVK